MSIRRYALRGAAAAGIIGAFVQCVGSDPDKFTTTPDDAGNASSSGGSTSSSSSGSTSSSSSGSLADAGDAGPPVAEGNYTRSFVVSPSFGGAPVVAVDGAGTTYLAIDYGGSGGVTLDGGTEPMTTSSPLLTDIAVAKLLPDGSKAAWVTTIKGDAKDSVYGITVDASGDVYVAGTFASPKLMAGTEEIIQGGTAKTSGFIAKFRGTDGKALWAKAFKVSKGDAGGAAESYGGALGMTPKGGVAFAFGFRGDLEYASGSASSPTHIASLVALLDAKSGEVTDGQLISGVGDDAFAPRVLVRSLRVDRVGNVYAVGETNLAAVTLAGKQLNDSGNAGIVSGLVVRLDADLKSSSWHRVYGGNTPSSSTSFVDVAIDDTHGSAYILGTFEGKNNFGFGDIQNPNLTDLVALKVATATGIPAWAQALGGPSNDSAGGIAVDPWGRPFMTGALQNLSGNSIDGGGALPNGDAFLALKLDPADGKILYLTASGTENLPSARSVISLPNGRGLVTGTFSNKIRLEEDKTGQSTGAFIGEISP